MSPPRYQTLRFVHSDFDATEGAAGLRLTPTGALALAKDEAAVRQAVLLLLSTVPGERVMRPDYGCELHRLALGPNDDTTAGLAIHYVRRALERWEPRIQLLHVDAHRSEEEPARLDVSLEYRVRSTQRTDRMLLSLPLAEGSLP